MIFFILLLPLLASILSGFFSTYFGPKMAARLPSACSMVSVLATILLLGQQAPLPSPQVIPLFKWLSLNTLDLGFSIYLDNLALVMIGVVTFVSFAVHLYSLGYMAKDPHRIRFMSYLSLFTFMMLLMVVSGNLVQFFIGWEGIGLCSYLLIGFWFQKEGPQKASLKAFLTNRIGDFFLVLGIVGLFYLHDTLSFSTLLKIDLTTPTTPILQTLVTLCFLGAAMAKSAQIGLHIWLPDAMEGPTPVSALIHAATLVTAGIFLLLRIQPLLNATPFVLDCILFVGSLTLLFGALMALFQRDLKRIIAYSTCSQLGYMMVGIGLSAYGASLFHLTTHAFFKALLFLAAGSVIHISKGEKDISRMGGLGFQAPLTYGAMLLGLLCLSGVPMTSGSFSKDLILEHAWIHAGPLGLFAFISGTLGIFLTGLYSARLFMRVFHSAPPHPVKESPPIFYIPLLILGILALASGFLHGSPWVTALLALQNPLTPWWLPHALSGVACLGLLGGILFYAIKKEALHTLKTHIPYDLLFNQFYVEKVYGFLFIKPYNFVAGLLAYLDFYGLDAKGPLGLARGMKKLSIKTTQHLLKSPLGHGIILMGIGLSVFLLKGILNL